MYYSARVAGSKRRLHCVGAAFAHSVKGPYIPMAEPLACPLNQGGAIDPSAFQDADGKRYVVYKVDGNSFDRPNGRHHPTPLVLQEVAADGVTYVGSATTLLDRQISDGPLIEAPALARYDLDNGTKSFYALFFSSNVFTGPRYNVLYATSSSVQGPFVRAAQSLLATGDGGGALIGPGGMDVGNSSTKVVFHSIRKDEPGTPLTRTLWVGELKVNGTAITI